MRQLEPCQKSELMTHSVAQLPRDPTDMRILVKCSMALVLSPAQHSIRLIRKPGYETRTSDLTRYLKRSTIVPAPPWKTRPSPPILISCQVIYQLVLSPIVILEGEPCLHRKPGLATCHAKCPSCQTQHYLEHLSHQTIQAYPRQLLPSQKCPTQPSVSMTLCLRQQPYAYQSPTSTNCP